jgi:AraC-like DNA-binding protein
MKRARLLLLIFTPFVFIAFLFFLIVFTPDYTLYPGNKIQILPFNDSIQKGKSVIDRFYNTDSGISLSYTLRKGFEYPYAGMYLSNSSLPYFPDLSKFDDVEIDIQTSNSRSISFFITTFEPGITKENNAISYRQLLYEIPVHQKKNNYSIPLKDFKTAAWWYTIFHLSEKDLGEPRWDKVKTLNISSSSIMPLDMKDDLSIKSIRFRKNYSFFFIISLSLIAVFFCLFGAFVYYRKKLSDIPPKIIPYIKLELENNYGQSMNKIISYLAQNYTDPELTIVKIAEDLGMSGRTVSDSIQKYFNLTYKQYLNGIRLNEAKRLLQESDLNVSEIAFKVGYNNITHFNRAFKQYTNHSPSEFKAKN